MLLDRSADVYRARNINDNADLVALRVVSGPSGSFAAFWGYCIQSKAFQLDISSLPSYGLTTMGQCAVHPLIQPDDEISALDQRLFLKQMIEYPRHMLWHPLGRSIVVAELGVLYIFNLVWLDKRTNERIGMVEAAHRIVLISTGNYATTNSMDDDMIPTEVLSVEIKQVKQLDLRVTAVSLLFPSNGLLLGTSNDTVLTLDWEGNQIPYLPTDSHHHHEDQQKHEDRAQSAHWVDNDRAMQCLWRPSVFLLRASHGLHSQRRHHHVSSAEHLTINRDYPTTSPVPHPYSHPLYSSTEEVIKEIVCDNRSPQMVFVLFVDGSFSLSVQSSRASAARSPVPSGAGGGGGGDPQSSMTSSTSEFEEQADREQAVGGLQQGDNSSSSSRVSSNRVSFTCTDRIHPVALVAYPFDDAPSAPPPSSAPPSSAAAASTSGKTAEKRPSIYELARPSMMMRSSSSSSLDGRDLRCSIYRSRDYVTSHDVDSLLQLTPTLRKKVCRMRSLVTGHCKEELSSVLTMALIDDDAGPLKSTGDESPITTSTTSSSSSSTTTSSNSSVHRTYPMPVRRTRLLVLMRTKHLLPTADINDNIIMHHHHHHHPVYPKPTSSAMHGSIIGRRPLSYSLVVLEFIAKGCALTSGPLLSTGEVVGKCIQSVCVGRTYSSDDDDDDDDETIDIADSSSSSYHLEIIRMSQCAVKGLYALLLCNGVITCRPIQSLHSILFTLDAMSCCSRELDNTSSLKMRNADYCHGLHTINVSVALSTVIVSVWSQCHHHHHHHHYYSSQQQQGDDTVKQEAIALSASSQSKVFILSMSTALSASTAGAGSSQSEGVFVDYSKGQLSFVGPSMPTAAAVSGMGDDGSSAYFPVEGDDTVTTGTAGISDDCYRLQLRLPARLRVDVSWYQQQCSSVSSALLQQQQWRGIRRPPLRIYQHGLLVANSAQRHCSSIDIDIDPTSPLDEVGHQGSSISISTISDAAPHYTATYLACIAGGSVVPHKDRPPPKSHKKPSSSSSSSSSSSYSTHQSSQSPPLLWIYNCTTHRWRSTYLTIGNSLSNASSFVNIPHKGDDQSCRIHPRTADTPIIIHYTQSLDELNPCITPMSVKSIESSSSCPSTPLAHSSFDYGDFSNHLDVRMSDFGEGYFSPPVDSRPMTSRPMKTTNYLLSSPIKHTITSSPSNRDKTIMRAKQRQLGFEPTRQQRSSSVLIPEHSHLALTGGVFVVFAIAWHGIHTIILLTQRRAFHCLEIVSREVTKASSMVGTPHPAVHKVIQLPPGYLPTLLEMRDVTVRHSKSCSSPVRFTHSWREDAGSSMEDSTHRESNAGMDSCSRPTVADVTDTCVVVVSDGKTMLCYSISRELLQVKKSQQSVPSSSTRARTGGVIYDYSVVELWDFHISSLTEQLQLFGPCLRMSGSASTTAAASSSTSSSSSSSSSGHKISLPIRETHLFFIRSCQLNDDAQSAARPHRSRLPCSSSSSALLLVDGQGKVVFVDPRRKLFEVISLGPVHRIVQLNSSDAVASRHPSRHMHHSSHDHINCNSHLSDKESRHKEHGGDEGGHPNYIPSSSSSSVIRRMDNVFLFLSIHNHICDSYQQLVTIFRKTQLLQHYRIHSEDSMAIQHSQLWIPMELLRPSDMIERIADDEEGVAGSPSIQPDHTEERSVTMTSLSIRLPPLESNAMLIHIDALSSIYLHPNADFQLPSYFSTGSNRYFLSNRKPLQTSIFQAILHALIRLSKRSSTSTMPTAGITESGGDSDALAAAARLSIAICTCDGGYSCWRDDDDDDDDDSGSLYSCCTEDTSLMQRVLKEVLQQNLFCSTRGRRSYSASFLSHLELSTKQMIESSQQRSSNAPHHLHHHHHHHHDREGMQRYVDFTRHLSSLDPLLLCELVSRLGRKLEPSTSKLLFPINIDVDPKTAAGAGEVEVGVVSLYEACLVVNPPHFQYAARTLSIACEELGGTEGHLTATASLILALEFLYLSTTHYSLKNAFECFEFCLRIEGMLRVHSTALIEEMMEGEEMGEKASSGSHSSSPTALLEYSITIKQKALDLISSCRRKSRSSTSSSSSSCSSLPRSAADGDSSNGVDRSEARETSHADLFLVMGSHLVPFLIELGISWLFAERRHNAEPSISADTSSTAVHPEAEVVAAVDASQAESVHYADTSYDDDDPSRSKTHGPLLSKKASASSVVTSEVLRERVEGSAYRYLAMEALELEYGASTVGRVICQPMTGIATTPLHKEDGFGGGGGGGGGADAIRHWVCSRGLTLSLVVIIIRDLLCCEYQFFTAAVVITMFSRNRCFQESVLSLLLQMYADEGILGNYDERDDGSSKRHSQTIIDSDSTRGGRYSADEKLRRILHVFGLTSIVRKRRMMMKEVEEKEKGSQQQVEGMSMQLLLLRAVSPQYIRRVVVEAAAHSHTHGGVGAVSTGGGYFELMPLSDHHHHHHPLHADLAASSYSLLSLLKSLVLALLLVRDRDTASLLLRTISFYITAKVDPSLHLALSMDGEDHTTSNEAILRALL